jgi:hypothetical protein
MSRQSSSCSGDDSGGGDDGHVGGGTPTKTTTTTRRRLLVLPANPKRSRRSPEATATARFASEAALAVLCILLLVGMSWTTAPPFICEAFRPGPHRTLPMTTPSAFIQGIPMSRRLPHRHPLLSIRSKSSSKSSRGRRWRRHMSSSEEASPSSHVPPPSNILEISDGAAEEVDADDLLLAQQQEQEELQWSLFTRHHVGTWNGLWTTVNDMADVMDETVARTILEQAIAGDDNKSDSSSSEASSAVVGVRHAHVIPVASTRSDCDTCFNDPAAETRTLEVATYQPHTLLAKSKVRLASRGIVVGPKVLPRTGSMALEVGLRFGNARIRAAIILAPAWEPGVEPMSCPPHALRVARITLHREVLASVDDDSYYPTPQSEEARWESLQQKQQQGSDEQSSDDNEDSLPTTFVRFHRGVPPFAWHRDWRGTAWTWGPQSGDRGWQLDQVELEDQWHGNNPVGRWNWRTQSVYVQLPKLVTGDETALFRMAWLADPDHLLRIEAGVLALQPIFDDDSSEGSLVGLEPPKLVSLRCDTLQAESGGDES